MALGQKGEVRARAHLRGKPKSPAAYPDAPTTEMPYIWLPTDFWMDNSVFLFIQMFVNYKKAICASKPNRDYSMISLHSLAERGI